MILAIASSCFGVIFLYLGIKAFLIQKARHFFKFDIWDGLTLVGSLLFVLLGLFLLGGSLMLPVKKKVISYTDDINVTKIDDLYYVSMDGKDIPVAYYQKSVTENNRYELKIENYDTILTADAGTIYTLIIPVKEEVLQ